MDSNSRGRRPDSRYVTETAGKPRIHAHLSAHLRHRHAAALVVNI